MEEGRIGVTLEGPIPPTALTPVLLIQLVEMQELILQVVSKCPTFLVKASRIGYLVEMLHLGEEVLPVNPLLLA
jgi:hypothetical protein